jgi:hypothetical protein
MKLAVENSSATIARSRFVHAPLHWLDRDSCEWPNTRKMRRTGNALKAIIESGTSVVFFGRQGFDALQGWLNLP